MGGCDVGQWMVACDGSRGQDASVYVVCRVVAGRYEVLDYFDAHNGSIGGTGQRVYYCPKRLDPEKEGDPCLVIHGCGSESQPYVTLSSQCVCTGDSIGSVCVLPLLDTV
jgi:hypothetical protein